MITTTGNTIRAIGSPARARIVATPVAQCHNRARGSFAALLFTMAMLAPLTAHADGLAEAQDLFARARAFRAQGDCASALPLLRQAFEVYPAGLGSVRNIAECEEALGHYVEARRAWLDLGEALRSNRDPKYEGWALDAAQGAERAASKIPPPPIAAGEATSTGSPAPSPRIESPPPRTMEPARSGNAGLRAAGWTAIAVGGAALVGAGTAFIARQVYLGDLPPCASTQCLDSQRPSVQPIVDHGHTAATLADVFGAIGVAGVAIGLTLVSVASGDTKSHAPSASPAPRPQAWMLIVGPGQLRAEGRF